MFENVYFEFGGKSVPDCNVHIFRANTYLGGTMLLLLHDDFGFDHREIIQNRIVIIFMLEV